MSVKEGKASGTARPRNDTLPSPEEIREVEEWGRRVRREMADWEFIRGQPPRLRRALEYFVETGDLYVASRIAGMTVDRFNELRIKARIPVT